MRRYDRAHSKSPGECRVSGGGFPHLGTRCVSGSEWRLELDRASHWFRARRIGAQQSDKVPTIGFLGRSTRSATSEWTTAFVQRLRELGWIEGRNVTIEYRWGEGLNERFAQIAAEFVRLKVDVIVTEATQPTIAAKQ